MALDPRSSRYRLPGQDLSAPVLDRPDFSGLNDDSTPGFDSDNQLQSSALPDPDPLPPPPVSGTTGPAQQIASAPPPAPTGNPAAYRGAGDVPPASDQTGFTNKQDLQSKGILPLTAAPPPPPPADAGSIANIPAPAPTPPPAPINVNLGSVAPPTSPTMNKLRDIASRPPVPGKTYDEQGNLVDDPSQKPSWARRLLAGLATVPLAVGEMKGTIKPDTAQSLEQSILYPGYRKARNTFETQRADLENLQGQELKQTQIEAQAAQRDAMATYQREHGAYLAASEQDRAQANRDRMAMQTRESNRKFLEDRLKGREGDAVYQQDSDQKPAGWDFIPDPEKPGAGYAVPPAWMLVTDQMKIPGRKAGDMIPWSEFKQWQKAADTSQNKPAKLPGSAAEVLLNPGQFTPDQVAEAKRQFSAEHRPPAAETPAVEAAREHLAQGLANGDLTRLRDVASLRGEDRLLVYDRAKQLNPQFDTSSVDRKIQMENYYTNGKGEQNLQSFGTFLEHAGEANDAANQMWNTQSRFINKPLNWWRANISGDPAYTNLVGALEPVRKEFEGFLLGGRALYGDDRRQAEIILSDNSSPQQIQNALKRMGHTAVARFNEENFRYKREMGYDLKNPLSPQALEGAQKIGVPIGTGSAAPAGGGGQRPGAGAQKPGGGQRPPLSSFEQ